MRRGPGQSPGCLIAKSLDIQDSRSPPHLLAWAEGTVHSTGQHERGSCPILQASRHRSLHTPTGSDGEEAPNPGKTWEHVEDDIQSPIKGYAFARRAGGCLRLEPDSIHACG